MTDAAEILSPSPTGVPARLRIAGVGARAYAFTVDFNIRIAIAFAWYSTGAVLHSSVNAAAATRRAQQDRDPTRRGPPHHADECGVSCAIRARRGSLG